MPICMFISITSPFILQTGHDYRHDPMITGQVVIVLKANLLIDFYCLHVYIFPLLLTCLVYGIPSSHHVIHIITVLVLLLYILLPPSFYHSLGRFLTTLGLHAQVGDPSYRIIRQCLGSHRRLVTEIIHRYLCDLFPLSYLSLFSYLL